MPEDPSFPPLTAIDLPDAGTRLAQAVRDVRRRKRRRAGIAAGTAATLAVAAVAVVLPLSLSHASSSRDVATLATPSLSDSSTPSDTPSPSGSSSPDPHGSATTPADVTSSAQGTGGGGPANYSGATGSAPVAPPTTADLSTPVSTTPAPLNPAPTTPTPAAPTASSSPTGPPTTGTVTDAAGAPLAGEYVIGLDDFTTVRTDAKGLFSLPCSGSGQPLVVADWDIPLLHPGSVDESEGTGADDYSVPTTSSGVGDAYAFGPVGTTTSTADQAPVAACGTTASYVLQEGGQLHITFVSPGGKPLPADSDASVKLPSLGQYTFYATLPVSKQVYLPGLPAGDVTFASTYPATSDCSGTGVTYDGDFIFTVPVVAGQTTTLTCTLPTGY